MKRSWLSLLVLAPMLALSVGCPKDGVTGKKDAGADGSVPQGNYTVFQLDDSTTWLGSSIQQISIAVRSDDTVGVAFFAENGVDVNSRKLYDIRYLKWNGTTSTPETVRNVFDTFGLSVAFQPSGEPAVAHMGGSTADATFWPQSDAAVSYRAGGTWTEAVAVVDSNEAPGSNAVSNAGFVVGVSPSLVFINGAAFLAYRDVHNGQSAGGGDYGGSDLELASGAPGAWTHEMVQEGGNDKGSYGGHNQMVVGAGGQPAIATDRMPTSANSTGIDVLYRSRNASGAWEKPKKEPFYDLDATKAIKDNKSGPSLAWDAQLGYAIAANNAADSTLYYTQSTNPVTVTWDAADPVVQEGTGSWFPSVAIDPQFHEPAIAFYFCSSTPGKAEGNCTDEDQLRVVQRKGGQWQQEVVDEAGGYQAKLAFLSTGKKVLVYRDPRSKVLKMAVEK